MNENLNNSDVSNIVNFNPTDATLANATSATTLTTSALNNTTTAAYNTITGGYWSYQPYSYGSIGYSSPTILQAKNGFVVNYGSDTYIAKNMTEVTKILNSIFNPKKGKTRG